MARGYDSETWQHSGWRCLHLWEDDAKTRRPRFWHTCLEAKNDTRRVPGPGWWGGRGVLYERSTDSCTIKNLPEPAICPEALSCNKVSANPITTLRWATIDVSWHTATDGVAIITVITASTISTDKWGRPSIAGNESDAISHELNPGLRGRSGLLGWQYAIDQPCHCSVEIIATSCKSLFEFGWSKGRAKDGAENVERGHTVCESRICFGVVDGILVAIVVGRSGVRIIRIIETQRSSHVGKLRFFGGRDRPLIIEIGDGYRVKWRGNWARNGKRIRIGLVFIDIFGANERTKRRA